tara:strand:- start:232 stop:471 length:240 start_codon:yes stop_codon:yes gene_type:complete
MTHRDDELGSLKTSNVPSNRRKDHDQPRQRSTVSILIKLFINICLVFRDANSHLLWRDSVLKNSPPGNPEHSTAQVNYF